MRRCCGSRSGCDRASLSVAAKREKILRMKIAILSGGDGWHVRDLARVAGDLGHTVDLLDFRTLHAGVGVACDSFAGFDAVLVRTMSPGSLEQVVFRMDILH